ncbi:ferredoxin-dependent glutamate synthase [Alkalidesulfovibrio alkalitolerans DSM 16529]|uniref:glutamate synthase (NADPH) n=1 Tax=Alkalidesulfovibrio alkalitolerans DSM 16529 TaxID=1121439 RepID=S7T1E0_9BACT|nr:glutamate synthase-related protein [Alkalidesulfovibrio alkalitolerans]EPR30351.1 ferredoxin-dependent glutamate synthase [Alkalidesulfovibrio alkalitolerans DSM 16529]
MAFTPITKTFHEFHVDRDREACIDCQVCVRQCSYGVHTFDENRQKVVHDNTKCVGCHRCAALCPTQCLTIRRKPSEFREHHLWKPHFIKNIYRQAETGGVLLGGMGCVTDIPIYFDNMLLDASQVTNPSIDPLREPMELKTFLGAKPERIELEDTPEGPSLKTTIAPQIELNYPLMFAAMSLGAINFNLHVGMARAATELGIAWNTGEGGLHKDLYQYGKNTIVQVASGRFGVHRDYLNAGCGIEIKIGQGAKPGIGGHLPGEKIDERVSQTRMVPLGSDAISPAPHHDIYSIEDLLQLIYALKEATAYTKPVAVKIAAVHHAPAIASGIVRAGADIVCIDGMRGGTGAAPVMFRDYVGIPIELALASVDQRLREEGIRNRASIVVSGGVRCSADVVKAIALGADAVYIGTAALMAVGCTMCGRCYTGKCPWGIATNDPNLAKRQNPDIAARKLANLVRAWGHEIQEMLGAMGLNSIESLRGNRDKLRAVGLNQVELDILGLKHAGR